MEPKEPVGNHKFSEFDYETMYDETPKLHYEQVRKEATGFYNDWINSGRTHDEFFELLRGFTAPRELLHVAVATRTIDERDNPEYTDISDRTLFFDAWYESFLQYAYIAEATENMTPDDLLELRDHALGKLVELNASGKPESNFTAYASELSWYSHVATGASIMADADPLEAYNHAHAYLNELMKERQGLEHMQFLEYRLFQDKIHPDTDDTGELRKAAAYVAEGLDDDETTHAAARSFASIQYMNLTAKTMYYSDPAEKQATWSSFLSIIKELYPDDSEPIAVEDVNLEEFKPMEVDWEVLPPGNLRDYAVEIVENENERRDRGAQVHVDPDRLNILEEVRRQWGADKSYYAKGSLRRRTIKEDESKRCPDQYIMLILQDKGADGEIIEHAVAESPIAGPHAMYVFRQDVNPNVNWRQVMSVEKREARALGARPLKHPAGIDNGELTRVMSDRVADLMIATPEEFLRIGFNGSRTILRTELAIKAFATLS